MTSTKKDSVLAVLQLSGGNDALNTVVPYSNPLYADNRPSVRVSEDQVLKIDDNIGSVSYTHLTLPTKRIV